MLQCPENAQISRKVLISSGSNVSADISDATELVLKCKRFLSERLGTAVKSSRIFRTPAFPAGAGPDFANAVFAAETDLGPQAILGILHQIEAAEGRTREVRWGQRVLDLDLIAAGDLVAPDRATWQSWHDLPLQRQMKEAPEQLILPHPRVQDRPFVLVPMRDVCPDWVHPVLGLGIDAMLARCDPADITGVIPLE